MLLSLWYSDSTLNAFFFNFYDEKRYQKEKKETLILHGWESSTGQKNRGISKWDYRLLWWSDKWHFSYNCLGLSDEDNSVSRTDNFMNVNVFNSVTSPRVLSYRCVLHYFSTMPVGFNFKLTFGLKPQVDGIKMVTVCKRSILQVEWLMATLISSQKERDSPFLFLHWKIVIN